MFTKPMADFKKNRSLLTDITSFLLQNKKWWIGPIVVVLVLMGVLIALGGTAAAPFIYTIF